jgi:hypothetical protein
VDTKEVPGKLFRLFFVVVVVAVYLYGTGV